MNALVLAIALLAPPPAPPANHPDSLPKSRQVEVSRNVVVNAASKGRQVVKKSVKRSVQLIRRPFCRSCH